MMTDKEWERFFTYIDKIVNAPNMPWKEKAAEIKDHAGEYASANTFEEFCNWFPPEDSPEE